MAEQIEAVALVEAVAAFLAGLPLEGAVAFEAKVAANALGIVARELRQRPHAAEAGALGALLGHDAPLPALRAELCGRLRAGQMDAGTPGLLEALSAGVVARLAVDNPRYSTLERLAAGR
jgi:hypothetical protein